MSSWGGSSSLGVLARVAQAQRAPVRKARDLSPERGPEREALLELDEDDETLMEVEPYTLNP